MTCLQESFERVIAGIKARGMVMNDDDAINARFLLLQAVSHDV